MRLIISTERRKNLFGSNLFENQRCFFGLIDKTTPELLVNFENKPGTVSQIQILEIGRTKVVNVIISCTTLHIYKPYLENSVAWNSYVSVLNIVSITILYAGSISPRLFAVYILLLLTINYYRVNYVFLDVYFSVIWCIMLIILSRHEKKESLVLDDFEIIDR